MQTISTKRYSNRIKSPQIGQATSSTASTSSGTTYINNILKRFKHPDPKMTEHLPHKHRPIQYEAKEQYVNDKVDTSPKLDAKGTK